MPPNKPSHDERDDFELMAAIAARDSRALRTLYERYKGRMYAICLRVLRNVPDAEDCVLDVLREIWEKTDRYNPNRGAPRTYLMMLTRSRAIDRKRSRQLRVADTTNQDDVTPEIVSRESRAQRSTAETALLQQVSDAMSTLDEQQRAAIEMSFLDGMTHPEIAAALQVPEGTIKSRIRRGLFLLRQLLIPDSSGGDSR